MKPEKCAVLFSGGVISTISVVLAKTQYEYVETITLDYGQPNNEVENVKTLVKMLEVPSTIVEIPTTSSFICKKDFYKNQGLRDYLLLTLGVGEAVKRELYEIFVGGYVHDLYFPGGAAPSVTLPFYRKALNDFEQTVQSIIFKKKKMVIGTGSIPMEYDTGKVRIYCPFNEATPGKIAQVYKYFEVTELLKYTVSCEVSSIPCGTCFKCRKTRSRKRIRDIVNNG